MGMRLGLRGSRPPAPASIDLVVAEFYQSVTLAQGLAWEGVAGSVSFWGDCQIQTSPSGEVGVPGMGNSPQQHQNQLSYA